MNPVALPLNLANLADALTPMHGPRRDALDRFRHMGLPDIRQEDWRYTSLAHLERMRLHVPETSADLVLAIEDYPGALMAFVDDRLIWQDTTLATQVLGTLSDGARGAGLPQPGSLAGPGALSRLNAALWREGACLRVPAGQRLRQPVFLRHAAADADAMLHPRVLVAMAEGADAILVEHYLGDPGLAYWRNPVAEILLEPGARLTHIRILEESDAATHTGRTVVSQARDSTYRALNLSLGGRLARHELEVRLEGEGAAARLDGLFVADGRQQADHHLRVLHEAPRTVSRAIYRGLAHGRGRGVFDARAVVGPGAAGADARQSSRNLLLSPHAEIDARPQLEIYTDDVKCGHGATVGQLDQDALFYLRSRGLDEPAARRLLMEAFAGEALGLLDDTGLKDWLMPRLLAALPIGNEGEGRP